MTEEWLFRDTENAVKFAFSICEMSICAQPGYVKVMIRANTVSSGRATGMTMQDWHAQGALIRKRVSALDPLLSAYGFAAYSWSEERDVAVQMVEGYVLHQMHTIKNHKLLGLLVRRYLDGGRGKRQTISEVARSAGAHHSWTKELDARVGNIMDELHWTFTETLDRQFIAAGLIPEPEPVT